jgi:hypothetical protein
VAGVGSCHHRRGGTSSFAFFVAGYVAEASQAAFAHSYFLCRGAILTALLTFAVIGAIGVARQDDKFGEGTFASPFILCLYCVAFLGSGLLLFPAQFLRDCEPRYVLVAPWWRLGTARFLVT